MVFPTAAGARHALEKYRPAVLLVGLESAGWPGRCSVPVGAGPLGKSAGDLSHSAGRGTGRGDWISEWCRRLCGKAFRSCRSSFAYSGTASQSKGCRSNEMFCDDLMLDKKKLAVYYQQQEVMLASWNISFFSCFWKTGKNCH